MAKVELMRFRCAQLLPIMEWQGISSMPLNGLIEVNSCQKNSKRIPQHV
jgi:hypothetical protein